MSPLKSKTKLDKLKVIAKEISDCAICSERAVGQLVPGEGNIKARVVFVGEAPGKLEAACGRPFIGRAGQLLRLLISGVGLKETEVFITSAVKYLPVYVTPKLDDIEHGRVHLKQQLQIIKPKVVVLLGGVAAQAVLGEKIFIAQDHGRIIERDGVKYLLAYHPAAPLHNPKVKPDLENDFKLLAELLTHK